MKTHAVTFVRAALVTACATGLSLSLFAGKDYYVDANYGHDDWDGSTAAIPTEEQKQLPVVPGPRKTLAAAMAISGLAAGDTVHAAPGTYNEGEMFDGSRSNRVIVAAGVLLVADQGASVTTIEGKISTADGNTNGCAADSLRVAKLNDGAIIRGFTLTKGRSMGGGGGVNGGLAVECVFSNNVVISDSANRGNAACGATLLRCYIGEDPAGTWSCYASVQFIDCVYDSVKTAYSSCHAYNTTFVKGYIYQYATAHNCVFLSGNHANSTLYSCLTTSAEGTGTKGDDFNQFGVDKAKLVYDPVTYRPLPGSFAIDTGTDGYYALATNSWTGTKARWQSFIGTDFAGGPRRLGAAIDIGAGEADPLERRVTIADAQTALVVTGAAKGTTILHEGETNTFTLARDYSTEKLCTGVTVNGEFFPFSGESADKTYEYTYGYGDPVEALVIEAVYAEHNDWYVNCNIDPAKGPVGDDANDGYTKYRAKRTLAGAMANTLLKSGDTVHAAPGVYNEGGMNHATCGSNRVIVADGVLLVADQGASVTTIEGRISTADGSVDGCGDDSMRAVYLNSASALKGFTVTKGRTKPGLGDNPGAGAAVYSGLAVECVFSNNVASGRGNVAYGSALLRCYIGDNPSTTTHGRSWDGYAGAYLIDCVHNSGRSYYSGCHAYNTTFVRGYTYNGALTYNCIFLSGNDANSTLYSCLTTSPEGTGTKGDEKNRFGVAKTDLVYDPVTYRPLAGSFAIDTGTDSYYALATNGWTKTKAWWQSFIGTDYAGGPRRLGAAIDVGAGESDPNARTLTITDAQTALVVTGVAKGRTTLYAGQSVTFTLARDYSTAKLCTGVTVNGEFFSFTGEDADKTYEYTYGYDDPSANLVIEAVYAEHNAWYVNVNADPTKGPVGDDANDGYTKYRPKRTLVGAMTNALLAEGDTVHAAAGVYNEGTMADSPTSTITNRVIVKKNVGLVADEGKEVTAIEGFIPEESKWNTTDPIRAVAMAAGAYLKGFTVRNSMASMGQGTGTIYGNSGGGVSGGAAIIDCVVSNCYAVRGGGVGSDGAVLIRCRITGNKNLPNGLRNPAGGSASCTATAIYYSKGIYDSEVIGGATAIGTAVNSRFSDVTHNNSGGKVFLCNCYVVSDGGRLYLTNSVIASGLNANSQMDSTSRAGTTLKFDADGRPDISDPTTAKYAIDRGDNAYYAYPDAWASESGKDSAGGQRIYNCTVDIGAGEYDWRGAFAKRLARRGVALDVATPNVTTNLETGIDVPAGESLRMKLVLKTDGKVTFKVAADDGAAVTVTVGGEPVTPGEGGRYEFAALAGETEVEIAVTGEGQATVSDVVLPKLGTLLLVR